MSVSRRFIEDQLAQGVDERIAYILDTSNWPGTGDPTSVVVLIKDENNEDASGTHLSGSTTVSGDNITTPTVVALVKDTKYRLEVQWVKSGNTLEAYGFIEATL